MAKTVFGSTPKPVLPELLNKLSNPVYSQDPQEDGEIKPPTLDELPDVKEAIQAFPNSALYIQSANPGTSGFWLGALNALGPVSAWTSASLQVAVAQYSQTLYDISINASWSGTAPSVTDPVEFELEIPNPTSPPVPKQPILTDLINSRQSANVTDFIAWGNIVMITDSSISRFSWPATIRAYKSSSFGAYSGWSLRINPINPITWGESIGGSDNPRLFFRALIAL